MTAKPDTLFSAMALAFPEIEGATKDSNNPHFKTKYADLSSVVAAVKPALAKHGLWFGQVSHEATGGVCIETTLYHASGGTISFGKLYVPANKQDAQGYGSALTYARRYSLMTAFGVAPEDDDGNAAAQSAPPPARQRERQPEPEASVAMIDDIQRDTIVMLAKAVDISTLSILDTVNAKLPADAKVTSLDRLTSATAASIIKKLNATIEARKAKPADDILDDSIPY